MKLMPAMLYHGTAAEYELPRPGNDGFFWATDRPTYAQHYIPEATGRVTTAYLFASDMRQKVAPNQHDPYYAIALKMGFRAHDIKHDRTGRAVSFNTPKGYPTYGDIVRYIENELGYCSNVASPKSYELKTDGWDSENRVDRIVHASHKNDGQLMIVTGHRELKLFDLTGETRYPKGGRIALYSLSDLEKKKYDGIIIDDLCHSKTHGPVAHRSYGFFRDALLELHFERIHASHYEWPTTPGAPENIFDTPESERYKAARKAQEALHSEGNIYTFEQQRQLPRVMHR